MTRRGTKRNRRGIASQDAFDWALLGVLISIGILWRLLNIYVNGTFTSGARQRFWMADHLWSTSLLEMFGWVFVLFFILWLVRVFSNWPSGFMVMQRTAELSFLVWMGITFNMNMAVYKPDSYSDRVGHIVFEGLRDHPLIARGVFVPEEEDRGFAVFLGADGETHKYDYPDEAIRALYFTPEVEEWPRTALEAAHRNEIFVGRGVSCLDGWDYYFLEQYLIRDAILAMGIEPHRSLVNEWAELPPKPVEPDWCPKPGDPVGGWP